MRVYLKGALISLSSERILSSNISVAYIKLYQEKKEYPPYPDIWIYKFPWVDDEGLWDF